MMEKSNPSEIPDNELLRRSSNGDADSFGEFYDRYSTPIFNYILRLTHEKSAAEELLQEVFLAAWQGSKRFRGNSSVKTWIFRIAHNQAVSWLRKNRKDQQPIITESEIPDSITGGGASPEEFSFQNWQADQIFQALDQLSENHRAVIELTFIHEFTQKEIAQIMKCPTGTVKSRMSHALRRLNGILQQMGFEDQI